jgi:flagellar basal-body rod modification protein FlgD
MTTNSAITPAATAAPVAATPASPLASKNMFLQLLVAQLKNQDPSNPADSTQFVTQLAQFTTLEQSTSMRDDLDAIRAALVQPRVTQPVTQPSTQPPAAAATPVAGTSTTNS